MRIEKPRKISMFMAIAVFSGGANVSMAEYQGPTFTPVEIYACNYRDGKDMDDLQRVTAKWNAWMDKTEGPAYDAYHLVPFLHSPEISFDVAWLGVWEDGAAMGAGTAHWLQKGGALADDFGKVIDCDAHVNFAALTIEPEKDPASAGPVQFSNCTLRDGRNMAEAITALKEWNDYAKNAGIEAGRWILFPAYGESSDADYDFKSVAAFPSYDAFGSNYDFFGNGGGYMQHQRIVESKMTCDTPRVYDARPVRVSQE